MGLIQTLAGFYVENLVESLTEAPLNFLELKIWVQSVKQCSC